MLLLNKSTHKAQMTSFLMEVSEINEGTPKSSKSLDMDIYGLIAGWWFGSFFIFPYTGNNNPN